MSEISYSRRPTFEMIAIVQNKKVTIEPSISYNSDFKRDLSDSDDLEIVRSYNLNVEEWTNEEVCTWLEDCNFGEYVDLCKKNRTKGQNLFGLEEMRRNKDVFFHLILRSIITNPIHHIRFKEELINLFRNSTQFTKTLENLETKAGMETYKIENCSENSDNSVNSHLRISSYPDDLKISIPQEQSGEFQNLPKYMFSYVQTPTITVDQAKSPISSLLLTISDNINSYSYSQKTPSLLVKKMAKSFTEKLEVYDSKIENLKIENEKSQAKIQEMSKRIEKLLLKEQNLEGKNNVLEKDRAKLEQDVVRLQKNKMVFVTRTETEIQRLKDIIRIKDEELALFNNKKTHTKSVSLNNINKSITKSRALSLDRI